MKTSAGSPDYSHIETVYILGSGFSRNAGLPLSSDFNRALLNPARADSLGKAFIGSIKTFIRDTFNTSPKAFTAPKKKCPDLEDLFTCIDLAANSGHHLRRIWSPARLRTMRRALIGRILQVVNENYKASKIIQKWLQKVDLNTTAFITTNWDTALEREIKRFLMGKPVRFDYGCGARELGKKAPKNSPTQITIIKLHGSSNWLYCDNCRGLFYGVGSDIEKRIPPQLPKTADWGRISRWSGIPVKSSKKIPCDNCRTYLTVRLATFSYRKALDTPGFARSWFEAERILQDARQWIFVGYSLPPADYEFKYMLKRAQLVHEKKPPRIKVVVKKEKKKPSDDINRYKKFFGDLIEDQNCRWKDFEDYVKTLSRLRS